MVTLSKRACCSLQFITGSIAKKTATAKKHSSKNQAPTNRPNHRREIDHSRNNCRDGTPWPPPPRVHARGGRPRSAAPTIAVRFVVVFNGRFGTVHSQSEYRGTSGLVLAAKDQAAFEDLRAQSQAGAIKKIYWALVWGVTAEV